MSSINSSVFKYIQILGNGAVKSGGSAVIPAILVALDIPAILANLDMEQVQERAILTHDPLLTRTGWRCF